MQGRFRRSGLMLAILLLAGCRDVPKELPETTLEELKNSGNEALTVERGEAELAAGRLFEAQRVFSVVLSRKANDPRGSLGMGETLLRMGLPEAAVTSFEIAAADPEFRARGTQGRGLALLLLGRGAEAGPVLREAIDADASMWRAWNGLGGYYDSAGQWQDAEQAYLRALELGGDKGAILNNMGMSLMMQRRFAEAADKFADGTRAGDAPEETESNLRLAMAWQGHYGQAIAGMDGREAGEVLNNVGYVAMLRGDYAVAESYLTRALEQSPSYNKAAADNLQMLHELSQAQGQDLPGVSVAPARGAQVAEPAGPALVPGQ